MEENSVSEVQTNTGFVTAKNKACPHKHAKPWGRGSCGDSSLLNQPPLSSYDDQFASNRSEHCSEYMCAQDFETV